MKILIQFELRKILMKRLSILSIAAVLAFSFILAFSTRQNMYAFDASGREGSGQDAIEIDKSIAAKYAGILTDEKVQRMMADFRPRSDLHGMNAKYLYQNATQSAVFARFSNMDGDYNGLSVSDVFGGEAVQAGYTAGWLQTSQNLTKIFLVLSLLIILMVAPVFSGEYDSAQPLLLTSRYGKTKCMAAKAAASLLTALLVTGLAAAFNFAMALFIYGNEGLGCSILFAPLEFTEGYIPYNITCGTLLKYQILLAFSSAVSVAGMALILSAVCTNPMLAFASSAAVHVVPMLFPISPSSPMARFTVLLPVYHIQLVPILSIGRMGCGAFAAVLACPAAIFYFIAGAALSSWIFAKRQIS